MRSSNERRPQGSLPPVTPPISDSKPAQVIPEPASHPLHHTPHTASTAALAGAEAPATTKLLTAAVTPPTPIPQQGPADRIDVSVPAARRVRQARDHAWANEGFFRVAKAAENEHLQVNHVAFTSSTRTMPTDLVDPCKEDIDIKLDDLRKDSVRADGSLKLNDAVQNAVNNIEEAAVFMLAGGLWSRGGGEVKALFPYNIKQLLSDDDLTALTRASDIIYTNATRGSAAVLFAEKVNVPKGSTVKKVADGLVEQAQGEVKALLEKARSRPQAMNSIALRFKDMALSSRMAHRYMHFDILTSRKTHEPIRAYVEHFKQSYQTMQFDPDRATNDFIIQSLARYFEISDKEGETHLLGWQDPEYMPIDPQTGLAVVDEKVTPNGAGAGTTRVAYEDSGRLDMLRRKGVKHLIGGNVETPFDVVRVFAGHLLAVEKGADVSAVVVEQVDDYKGGNPKMKTDGSKQLYFYEKSAFDKTYWEEMEGNIELFNSNIHGFKVSVTPSDLMNFESKPEGDRLKQNALDMSLFNPTLGIQGEIGDDYLNFKSIDEFKVNGGVLLRKVRDRHQWQIDYIRQVENQVQAYI